MRPALVSRKDEETRKIREHNLINYSHEEDNKPDVVIRLTWNRQQEQMKSQLVDHVAPPPANVS